MWNDMEKQVTLNFKRCELAFLLYFPYLFTFQLTFLPYISSLFPFQLTFLSYFPYLQYSWYEKYGRKASWIVIRYGQYGRKASWIVKRYGKYGRKPSWIVKRYVKCGRKVGWNVKWYGKASNVKFQTLRFFTWNDVIKHFIFPYFSPVLFQTATFEMKRYLLC
jgi:hypothetical protein